MSTSNLTTTTANSASVSSTGFGSNIPSISITNTSLSPSPSSPSSTITASNNNTTNMFPNHQDPHSLDPLAMSSNSISLNPSNNTINNNSSNNSNNHHHNGNNSAVDLAKLRRESIAHSQGMGGVTWGSLTIGSWLKDEVMFHATLKNPNSNPMISKSRNNSIFNTLRRPSINVNNINYYASFGNSHSPPVSHNAYMPDLEQEYCKDYSCCGLSLPSLHDLLRHYEDAHIESGNPTSNSISSNTTTATTTGKKTKKVQSQNKQNIHNSDNNNQTHIIQQTLDQNKNTIPMNQSTTTSNAKSKKSKLSSMDPSSSSSSSSSSTTNSNTHTNTSVPINNNNNNTKTNTNTNINGNLVDTVPTSDVFLQPTINSNNNNNTRLLTLLLLQQYHIILSTITHSITVVVVTIITITIKVIPLKKINNNLNISNNLLSNATNANNNNNNNNNNSDFSMRNDSIDISFMDGNLLTNDTSFSPTFMNIDHHMASSMNDPSQFLSQQSQQQSHRLSSTTTAGVMGPPTQHSINNVLSNLHNHTYNSNNNNNHNNNHNNNIQSNNMSLDATTAAVNLPQHGLINANILHSKNSTNTNTMTPQTFQLPSRQNNNTTTNNNNNTNINKNNNTSNNNNNPHINKHQQPGYIDDPARRLYVMDHEEHKPFKCPVIGCEKTYKNQNGLKYHKLHGHQNQKLQENPDGTFTILDPDSNEPFFDNQGNAKDKPYRCEVCGKRYKNLNGLKYHRGHSTH
ncbi:uncharacterized protein NDAI_0D04320 [Naumovozyma dairenensis CBS 421]|uniref:C2H2-type domain-containing protein n=1 Tax=Naumovozyma dairenensis (strain ATCC 10597 / BCRC 20456 / CBS 421 / NBRC 0211 / NRRL Y-12639) TaxID=1071378 RepID=G0WAD5_NAUDC|nr:hypothetical protein NDAI_0D04320 [Naumovozyma dairenensis CBS 421]CCD24746.1 hypothetical protein NDAI_0D04320 [Naumovozyma dairenensis CBS 421]